MKTVFNNAALAIAFVKQDQDFGRNPHHTFYFQGDTIFSYGAHFPIAKIVDGTVLFTNRSYSNSTAKQISHVRDAIHNHSNLDVISVENVTATYLDDIVANINSLETSIALAELKASRARKHKDVWLDAVSRLTANLYNYKEWIAKRVAV